MLLSGTADRLHAQPQPRISGLSSYLRYPPTQHCPHLPHTLQNNVRFEASGICIAKDFAWVVFDSFRDIARLDLHFNYFGDGNIMVGDECCAGLLVATMKGAGVGRRCLCNSSSNNGGCDRKACPL